MKFIHANKEYNLEELKEVLSDNESMKEYYYETEEFGKIYEEYNQDSEVYEYEFVVENSYIWLSQTVYNELEGEINNAIQNNYKGITFLGQNIDFKC